MSPDAASRAKVAKASRLLAWTLSLSMSMPFSLVSSRVFAEPDSSPVKDVTRTSQQAGPLSFDLSRNLYKTESYQDYYTVSVPYEETETYYENVPYEDVEEYTDYESYTEYENVCHDVTEYHQECHDEQVCHHVPKQECHSENVCHHVPKEDCSYQNVCHQVPKNNCSAENVCHQVPKQECTQRQECHTTDHNSSHGPGQICNTINDCHTTYENECHSEHKCHTEYENECHQERQCQTRHEQECHTENVCHTRHEQECHSENKCRQVPTTHQECRQEAVTKQRPVTKTRPVTKYRQEERTRVVTKYREESRCCVTKEREVFDRQYRAGVEMNFPAEAALDANEREIFRVGLEGYDNTASLKVAPREAIYKYNAEAKQVAGDKFVVNMTLKPSYSPDDLGLKTISAVEVVSLGGKLQLRFQDSGVVKKVKTDYSVQVLDAAGGVLVQDQKASTGAQKIKWDLKIAPGALSQARVRIAVQRQGIVISAPVSFVWDNQVKIKPEAAYNAKPYTDKANINSLAFSGKKVSLMFAFTDDTKAIEQVQTVYSIKISLVDKTGARVLADKQFNREALKARSDGSYRFALGQDFGIADEELSKLVAGKVLAVEMTISREGTRFEQGMVKLQKSAKLTLK